jgi:hypothetical protein
VPEKVTPSYEKEIVEFVCDADGCDFTTNNEKKAEEHFGKEHAALDQVSIDDINFCYFATKEAADAWAETQYHDIKYVDWVGEGWYGAETGHQPCSRGCCTDYYIRLQHYSVFLSDWELKLKELQKDVEELRKLEYKD